MEVKIGVLHTPRELVLESGQAPAEVESLVADAIAAGSGVLSLVDERGRTVIVPSALVAYVEIAESEVRRVGFVSS